ncbi:adenylate/guanylate cyclase domain-containing protein [Anabaena subtropica]|uniref:Adenylate/guanylate cyclase domain-containing protein n=1 Tax=Anabaena subtropica FACHB-260 TaxID=2692884 RepID=A0ABR8CQG1_9NOST|nr:adenylate/guanylate cyclase domain-containing protein [Anabaena subtropica]MBD2345279.1 adenylate/guanylate cyclase domain-containing protein [Anabaena subtropica FACHB-260]
MHQLITNTWNWLLRFLLKRIILVLTLMFCLGVGIALANMSRLSSNLIESQAIQNAALYIESLNQGINLYSDSAVERAKTVNGITVTHAYLTEKGGIPLPSTFAIELGDRISEQNKEVSVRLYSDYPFPWRKDKGGAQDKFEQDALSFLRKNPNRNFFRFEKNDGHTVLRYGKASIMKASCVACHNTHPDSPKTDWEVGNVGGVWEINQTLDSLVGKVSNNLQGTFIMLGGMSFLGLSGLTLVIGRLRQTTKELEQRVKERTTDLVQANTDLEKRNRLIRKVFGRYLSDNIVANLLDSPEGLKLGGERRKITILTSDLRGFTALSEQLPPEEVITILNLYLEYMADVINKYQGTIDEFMGDGILVLFGAPFPRDGDALRAVACACAMQLAMGTVNIKMKELGLPSLEMGIGINTGEVVVGNIGSEQRTKYGIVGSQVNLTYRIESYTKGGQILISNQTLNDAGGSVKIEGQKQIQPKGFKQPITVYEVYGVGGFYNIYLPKQEESFFMVPEEIPLYYTILQEKHITNTLFRGALIKLSNKGAEIRIDENILVEDSLPPELTNIKINLLISNNPQQLSDDIYVKVLKTLANKRSFYIHFTTIPTKIKLQLDAIYKSISQ